MRRFRRILVVPVTNAAEPPAALIEAMALAEASGAEVKVLGHLDPLSDTEQRAADAAGVGDLHDRVLDAVTGRLRGWTEQIGAGSVAVDVAVGSLPEVVADAVEAGAHDLVMVAAARNPESAAAARRIVRATSCPVWLVRPGFEGSCVLAALDLDADPARNRLILDLARSQAELHGGRLRVMHAWQVGHLDVLDRMGGEPLDRETESEFVSAVETAHRATIDELLGDGIERGDVHLVDGSPGRSVVALAGLYRADLVVMGAGEATAGAAELGPTAEQVLSETDASVLVVQGSGPPQSA